MPDIEVVIPSEYVVTFDRIGRNHNVPPLTVKESDPDNIAAAVFKVARKYCASSWFEVIVNLEDNTGSIEYGRFGTFTLEPVA